MVFFRALEVSPSFAGNPTVRASSFALCMLTPDQERVANALLRSPFFHRAVRSVHKEFHRIRHGTKYHDTPYTEQQLGGVKRDPHPDDTSAFTHFMAEMKNQARDLKHTFLPWTRRR